MLPGILALLGYYFIAWKRAGRGPRAGHRRADLRAARRHVRRPRCATSGGWASTTAVSPRRSSRAACIARSSWSKARSRLFGSAKYHAGPTAGQGGLQKAEDGNARRTVHRQQQHRDGRRQPRSLRRRAQGAAGRTSTTHTKARCSSATSPGPGRHPGAASPAMLFIATRGGPFGLPPDRVPSGPFPQLGLALMLACPAASPARRQGMAAVDAQRRVHSSAGSSCSIFSFCAPRAGCPVRLVGLDAGTADHAAAASPRPSRGWPRRLQGRAAR